MPISIWLDKFRDAWVQHDIDAVMALFAEDVEYWETPFKKLESFEELRSEWQGITDQQDIRLETVLFNNEAGRYAVLWRLSYKNPCGQLRELAGTYLIEINEAGLCTYFHHTGELKP